MSNSVIETFAEPEALVVKTRLPGSYVNGRWVKGDPTEIEFQAAVVPLELSDMETQVAAAGLETRDSIVIYTEQQLKESDEKTKTERDVVTWNGNQYDVMMCVHRAQIPELAHYKAIAVLKGS